MTQSHGLPARMRALLTEVAEAYEGTDERDALLAMARRLDEPLRVAIAGRVKAGKSTLLNALVGERLAATDAGECTRVVTWYEHGLASRAWAHPHVGEPRQIPFDRVDGRTVLELGGLRAEQLRRLVVEVPSRPLEPMTLIDTPGIGSLSTEVSDRTHQAMAGGGDGDDGAPMADAVLYLMRHLHTTDVGFLETFQRQLFVGVTPINAIGVLSRADEVGSGRVDGLDIAGRIADDYRRDPRVRGLVQTVLPVAGLLGEAAVGLTERDVTALRALADGGPDAESLLLTADRFGAAAPGAPVDDAHRQALMAAMGLSGVRLSIALLRTGHIRDSGELSRELRHRSGLDTLRHTLFSQFAQRRDLLKAQAALGFVERVLTTHPVAGSEQLRARVEAVLAGAHELTEIRLANDLRTGVVVVDDENLVADAEALLGLDGGDVRSRLRLPADTPDEALRPELLAALRRWQRHEASPVAGPGTRRSAAVLRRTCEGLLRALPRADGAG